MVSRQWELLSQDSLDQWRGLGLLFVSHGKTCSSLVKSLSADLSEIFGVSQGRRSWWLIPSTSAVRLATSSQGQAQDWTEMAGQGGDSSGVSYTSALSGHGNDWISLGSSSPSGKWIDLGCPSRILPRGPFAGDQRNQKRVTGRRQVGSLMSGNIHQGLL